MATLSPPSSSLHSIRFSSTIPTSPSLAFCTFFPLQTPKPLLALKAHTSKNNRRRVCVTKAVEEETQQVQQEEEAGTTEQQQEQLPVVVPVSPSDTLTMFFQAEGTMSEATIPTLTKALETEGVANLKVQVVEGLASVELKKQTTVQATGVASSLVETIQGSGFKLQTLNLSFDDEDDASK